MQKRSPTHYRHQQTVTSKLSADRQWAIVRFQDNGRGMAAPLRSKIFEHLFTTKPVGKGTGLGLTLSRQIIEERHGGRLTVESIEGEGTTFSVALPLTDS
ncbi:MAG: sensor histidine kinase [Oscillatoriales cyanobacterium]|nr:MAG: sensor histidine kinase [Oscillatoriales cyanobacterium]